MLLLGFNYDLSPSFVLLEFQPATNSNAKPKNQSKTKPSPPDLPRFYAKNRHKKQNKNNKKKPHMDELTSRF